MYVEELRNICFKQSLFFSEFCFPTGAFCVVFAQSNLSENRKNLVSFAKLNAFTYFGVEERQLAEVKTKTAKDEN